MTTATAVWFVAAAAFAVANWWSRWSHHRPTEVWSKPLTLVALIGAAIALDPIDSQVRAWFVIALVLCLAGDVFLLGDDNWFVPGLAAFLAGHLAYVIGFVVADEWNWWYFTCAWIALIPFGVTLGHRILAAAIAGRPALRIPVDVVSGRDLVDGHGGRRGRQHLGGCGRSPVLDVRHDPRMAAVRRPAAVDAAGDHGHLPPRSGGAGDLA